METETEITYNLGEEIAAIIRTGTTITITPIKTDYGILFLEIQLNLPATWGSIPIKLQRCYLSETKSIAKTLHNFRKKFLDHH